MSFEGLSGAKGLRAGGKSAQNIAEYNAAVARHAAESERKKAAFAQKRQVKKASEIKSALTAKLGAAGGIGSLVAADLAEEQAAELELENLLLGYEGEVAAKRLESQAALDILQGKLAKQKGKTAARAANVQFGIQLASLATGFGGGGVPAGSPAGVQVLPSSPHSSFLTGFA